MHRTPALITGVALTLLAGAASAQWRDHGGHHDSGPGGFPPLVRDVRDQPTARGPWQPPHGQLPYGRPPPGPIYSNDSLGAGWGPQQDAVRAGVRQRRYVPLAQVLESIKRRGPGRELDAGLEDWNGRAAYRVRWAQPDGRRIDYMVDAESGAILGVDEGR